MHRLAQLEHHVIRDVHHVVDGLLTHRFQALPQPVRRRLHFHSAQNARGETSAEFRRFDFDTRRILDLLSRFFQLWLQGLKRQTIDGCNFARDAVMSKAIRTVRRNFRVQNRSRDRFLHRINRNAGQRKPRLQVSRRRLHVHEFFQLVVENLHG